MCAACELANMGMRYSHLELRMPSNRSKKMQLFTCVRGFRESDGVLDSIARASAREGRDSGHTSDGSTLGRLTRDVEMTRVGYSASVGNVAIAPSSLYQRDPNSPNQPLRKVKVSLFFA